MKSYAPLNVFVILGCAANSEELILEPIPGKVFDQYEDAVDALTEILDVEAAGDCLGDIVYTIRECEVVYYC